MTAQPDQRNFHSGLIDRFALARSDWLDSFSRLEVAVLRCAARFCPGIPPRGMPLSQRLKEICVPPSPRCSKDSSTRLRELVAECEKLLPLRATIVHSVMCMGQRDGSPAALFQNGIDVASELPIYAVLTETDFISQQKTLQRLADGFNSEAVSPSSPRPRAPASAAGP